MSGGHQSECNPTLDVSTRLRVGMPPLGGQATGYHFQGSRRLHPQQPVHRGDKEGEVPTLLEASLQIHLLLPLFSLVEALLRRFSQVQQGVSVQDTLFPTETDKACVSLNLLMQFISDPLLYV